MLARLVGIEDGSCLRVMIFISAIFFKFMWSRENLCSAPTLTISPLSVDVGSVKMEQAENNICV